MIPSPALRQALADLATAEQGVAQAGERRDEARKADLVKARRRLAEQLGVVGPLIETDPSLAGEADRKTLVCRQFSALRSQLAMHQANWPAIHIDDDPAAYMASAMVVRDRSSSFWSTCRQLWDIDR